MSALCLGGLIKHVAATEQRWANFIVGGAEGMDGGPRSTGRAQFPMREDETLAGLLEPTTRSPPRPTSWSRPADLDESHPLPEAPWFEPGARWSARRVLMHIIAETAQHSGHADIIRETLDGSKTMGCRYPAGVTTTTARQSLWLEALPDHGFPAVQADERFDVAVIGGGITG